MATIRIYLDESEGETAYIASGWGCWAHRWDCISEGWKAALDSSPAIPYFRLNDALGEKGPFAGWPESARSLKIEAMARAIPHEDGFFGHGSYIKRSDFELLNADMKEKYRRPYFFAMAASMLYAIAGENQIVGASKIDFILDKSKDAERMRSLFYSDLKPRFPKLGECLPLDDKETFPLQAADLNAGILRQQYEDVPRPVPGSSILNGIFEACWEIHQKGLEDIVKTTLFKKNSLKTLSRLP